MKPNFLDIETGRNNHWRYIVSLLTSLPVFFVYGIYQKQARKRPLQTCEGRNPTVRGK